MFGFTFQLMSLQQMHFEWFVLLFSWEVPDGIFFQVVPWFFQDPWDRGAHPSSYVAGWNESCEDRMPQGEDPRQVFFQDPFVLGRRGL